MVHQIGSSFANCSSHRYCAPDIVARGAADGGAEFLHLVLPKGNLRGRRRAGDLGADFRKLSYAAAGQLAVETINVFNADHRPQGRPSADERWPGISVGGEFLNATRPRAPRGPAIIKIKFRQS